MSHAQSHPLPARRYALWVIIACGCLIAALNFGPRSAMGFFQLPMLAERGWDRTTFALAMAIQNLLWGFGQPVFGALADRYGTWRVLSLSAVLYAIGMKGSPSAFPVFFASFLFLFAATGVGNASTFQMIPAIMRKEVARLEPQLSAIDRVKQSDKESAAIIGFTSAIAAFGAFFIPKGFGSSIALTGGAEAALYTFLVFYMSCIAVTWWFYTRRGGLLFDVERGGDPPSPTSALTPVP